jgi:chromate transporter
MISLFALFCVFFYVGAFTIGGGLVAITLMQQEIVGRGLISPERFVNMIAISESTPGPIGVNMATYIGYELYGVAGGIITTFGTVLPSLIVIIAIAKFFGSFQEKRGVKAAFYGLRAGSTGLIAVAAVQVVVISMLTLSAFQKSGNFRDIADWRAVSLFALVFALKAKFDLHPIAFIALGAVFGVFFLK